VRSCVAVVVLVACGGKPAGKPVVEPKPPEQNGPHLRHEKSAVMFTFGQCDGVSGTAEAAALYDKACTANDAESCGKLSALYFCGRGVAKDLQHAFDLDGRACELGSYAACGNLSMGLAMPDVKLDPARVMALSERGCAGGDKLSCAGIALMYLQGWGVPADPAKAAAIFEGLCTKDKMPMACANLSWLAYAGIGMAKDIARATVLAESACKQGMPAACNVLGAILIERNGPGDAHRAEALFSDLCDNGAAASCDNLGQLYVHGLGDVKVDLAKAKAAYERACKGDNAIGCRHLADLVAGQSP
jgi:TPR repeat protein